MKIRQQHLIALLFIVIIGSTLAAFGLHQFSVQNDRQRFKELDTRQAKLENAIKNSTGTMQPASVTNECYAAEQGPYDGGRLWCSTTHTYNVAIPVGQTAQNVMTTLDGLANNEFDKTKRSRLSKNIVTKNNTISDNAIFLLDPTTRCDFDATHSNSEQPSVIQIKTTCSSRATAKHYRIKGNTN